MMFNKTENSKSQKKRGLKIINFFQKNNFKTLNYYKQTGLIMAILILGLAVGAYGGNKEATRAKQVILSSVFKEPVKIIDCYLASLANINLKHELIPNAALKIRVTVSGSSNALFGLRGLAYEKRVSAKTRLGAFSTGIWKRKVGDEDTVLETTFRLPEFKSPVKALQFIGYNCNKQGSIRVKSIDVQLILENLAERAAHVEQLEKQLKQEGFTIKKTADLLIAEKPEQRKYYRVSKTRILSGDSSFAYLGSTYLNKIFKPTIFPTGPYIYGAPKRLTKTAAGRGMTLEQLLESFARDVKAHNCNTIYYANLTHSPETFKIAVKTAQKHGVSVFGQLTGPMYLRDKRNDDGKYSIVKSREYFNRVTVPAIKKYVTQYQGIEGVLGWMGREEPPDGVVSLLEEQRTIVKKADPTHNLFTLYNNLDSMRKDIDNTNNLPEWFGFDRYRFRHTGTPGPDYTISTPTDLVRLLGSEISQFQALAAKVGRPLIYVGQSYREKKEIRKKLPRKSGFRETEPGVWTGFCRYLPEHGMDLQFWLAISKGAKGFLMYFYQSVYYGKNHHYYKNGGTLYGRALVDLNGKPTRMWEELSKCLAQAKPLYPLFMTWSKEPLPFGKTDNRWVTVNSFVKDFKGDRFFVLQNTRISEWDKTSPWRTNNQTELYFDEKGLAGYQKVGSLKFRFTPEQEGKLYDVLSGKELEVQEDSSYMASLKPGRGRVYYQGTQDKLEKIRKELKL